MPDGKAADEGGDDRLSGANPFGDTKFTERNWDVLEVLRAVADEAGCTPAQAALAWLMARPQVSTVLIGASRPGQVADNVAALEVVLNDDQIRRLDDVSTPTATYPTTLFTPMVKRFVFGGADVAAYSPGG